MYVCISGILESIIIPVHVGTVQVETVHSTSSMGQRPSKPSAQDIWCAHASSIEHAAKMDQPRYKVRMSKELNSILNECGFSEERVKEQRVTYAKYSAASTYMSKRKIPQPRLRNMHQLFVGSQREGSSLFGSSDVDILSVYAFTQGFESRQHKIGKAYPAYFMEMTGNVPPGYCLLRLLHKKPPDIHVLIKVGDSYYLSNELYMNAMLSLTSSQQLEDGSATLGYDKKRQGPSTPLTMKAPKMTPTVHHGDHAHSLLCHSPSLLRRWRERKRLYDWPNQHVIDKVASLPAFAVPIGHRGSQNEALQWRLCFTMGEMVLVHSLNNTQLHLYVLLKVIAKYVLKPISPDITSFVMKNVLFWVIECCPQREFTPDTLVDRLADALHVLKSCIYDKELKYYMIPERNLFLGKISSDQQRALISKIDEITHENGQPYILRNLDNIKLFSDIYAQQCTGNGLNRMDVCFMSIPSVQTLGETMDLFRSVYTSKLAVIRYVFERVVYFILPSLFFYGLRCINDPLSVKHETIMANSADHDDYDVWTCIECTHVAFNTRETEV